MNLDDADAPVVIIGAGPVGLAAAAELITRGEHPIVLEAGSEVAPAIREWGHVRLFSPWKYLTAPAARRLLLAAGWSEQDGDLLPTGRELVSQYLEPLAAIPELAQSIRFRQKVTGITRQGMDKLTTAGREAAPFEIRVDTPEGRELVTARAVLDASGTWRTPNPVGADGMRALGEAEHADRIFYGIPDVLAARDRYAGRRVMVVGRGHSAFNALLDLAALKEQVPGTEITWATRKRLSRGAFGGGDADALPARGRLGELVYALVEAGRVRLVEEFAVARLSEGAGGLVVESRRGERVVVDEMIAATGFRPDLSLTTELRLRLDEIVESPVALAPLIDPNVHSCGSVPPHGEAELAHPEKGFYVVGMKSYGRAPTFLMLTGYEQVRSIACALTGDMVGAREVQLVLPETGVCSTGPALRAFGDDSLEILADAASCCTVEPVGAAQTAGSCCGTDSAPAERAGQACC